MAQNDQTNRAFVTLSSGGETPRISTAVAFHLHNNLKCSPVIVICPASHSVTSDSV